jgi:hypothetical protein
MTSMLIHSTARRLSDPCHQASRMRAHSIDRVIAARSRSASRAAAKDAAAAPRMDLVQRVRAAIEAGDYDDDAKMNVAVDRLLERLAGLSRAR